MPAPLEIEWSRLSPAARETAQQIGLRLTAGYSLDEVAQDLTLKRPAMKHLVLPPGRVKKTWVAARVKDLRQEITERGAASY